MISALLLPLLLAGDDPAIQLWINNDGRFIPGEHARVQVRSKDSGYLLVLHADPDGRLRVLFPLNPGDNTFVQGGERYELKDRGGREAFLIEASSGGGMVYAAVSTAPFRFDEYRQIDAWDNEALAPSPLPPDPESELTELVRRIAQADFDYDVVTYQVIEQVVYASDNGSDSSDTFVSDDHYYGGYWSPFFVGCSPFFFDPFFQCPVFFSPFSHEPAMITRFFPRAFFPGSPPVPTPFRDRRNSFSQGIRSTRAQAATLAGRRVQPVSETRRGTWPVDVSGGTQESPGRARRTDWPVDVSPRSSALSTMARRENWPTDVSPRLRGTDVAIGRRPMGDRSAALTPQMEPARLSGGLRIGDRAGIEAAPVDRGGAQGFSNSSPQLGAGLRSFAVPQASPSMRGFGFGRR
jgi:Domain of unknown function (DUF4384)